MTHEQAEQIILNLPGTFLDYPFGEGVAVYKYSPSLVTSTASDPAELTKVSLPAALTEAESASAEETIDSVGAKPKDSKMFALISEKSDPLRISLKCDPILAQELREKYETILPGYHLNKKHWNTIICSGQLSDDEITDLIRHSFELVKGSN